MVPSSVKLKESKKDWTEIQEKEKKRRGKKLNLSEMLLKRLKDQLLINISMEN